jgi:hypothetical protein
LHRLSRIDQVKRLLDERGESSSEWLRSLDVTFAALDVVAPLYELVVSCGTAGRLTFGVFDIGFL